MREGGGGGEWEGGREEREAAGRRSEEEEAPSFFTQTTSGLRKIITHTLYEVLGCGEMNDVQQREIDSVQKPNDLC